MKKLLYNASSSVLLLRGGTQLDHSVDYTRLKKGAYEIIMGKLKVLHVLWHDPSPSRPLFSKWFLKHSWYITEACFQKSKLVTSRVVRWAYREQPMRQVIV
jgi:hypothetical protein